MRILHYITDITATAGPKASAVYMMMQSTSKMVETHLITAVPPTDNLLWTLKEQCNVKTHILKSGIGRKPTDILSACISANKLLKAVNPDVVHIHGAWDWSAAMVERLARSKKIATLVSPHRALSAELLGIDFWSKKLPRLITYQALMVRNCTAVIAVNDKEKDDIKGLGLKKRIEVLPPISQYNENMEPLGAALVSFYRKALDSTYTSKLTRKEHDVVVTVLRSLIADDDVETPTPDISDVSFRRIYFHAYDEDVMPQFIEGCEKTDLQIPTALNVAEIPRYRNPKAKVTGALDTINAQPDIRKIPADKVIERQAVALIYKAKTLTLNRLTLRHYIELYTLFRHTDFDESIVTTELKRLRLLHFTKKLQKRLADMFGLRNGYNIIE